MPALEIARLAPLVVQVVVGNALIASRRLQGLEVDELKGQG